MERKELIISMMMNILIFIMAMLGTIFSVTGFTFMANTELLATPGVSVFKYYTVDSNVFVGLASLVLIVYEYLYLNKKVKEIPNCVYLIKYVGTVAVTLTFLVTLLYLSPLYGKDFLFLYQNSNFFFHLVIPILSFGSFVLFEKTDLNFKYTLGGISTTLVYGVYYAINIVMHQTNGIVISEYDWYGFAKGGIISIFIVFPIMTIFAFIISFIILRLNKPKKV